MMFHNHQNSFLNLYSSSSDTKVYNTRQMHLMHRDSHFNCPIYLDAAEFLNSKVLQKVQGYGIGFLKLSRDAVKLGVMMYNIVYLI